MGGRVLGVRGVKTKAGYKAGAKFRHVLSRPGGQAEWHQATGYLPITMAAYELTQKSGFYEKNPGTDVSVKQMIVKTTDKSRGIRLGNFVQIRDIIDEELDNVRSGKKSAKEAPDASVPRGNDEHDKCAPPPKKSPPSFPHSGHPAGLMLPSGNGSKAGGWSPAGFGASSAGDGTFSRSAAKAIVRVERGQNMVRARGISWW